MPTLNEADAVLLGDTPAQAVYLGDVQVWPPKMKWRFTIAADWAAHIASSSDGTAAFDFNRVNLDQVDADGFAIRAQPWGPGANPYVIIRSADGVVRYSGLPDNGHFDHENMLLILTPRPDFGALRTALGGTGASFTVEFGQGEGPLLVAEAPYKYGGTATGAASTHGIVIGYAQGLASYYDLNDRNVWADFLAAHVGQPGKVLVTYASTGALWQTWTGNFTSISNNRWTMTHAQGDGTNPPVDEPMLLTAYLL